MEADWFGDINWFFEYGPYGLFLLAFAEAVFFLVPPDVMLVPLAVARPHLSVVYALVTTVGSVLGGVFGYFVGRRAGRPVLLRIVPRSTVDRIEELFARYGGWAVLTAALTPVPYKAFTIGAGIFRVRLTVFTAASVVGRGLRFCLEALLVLFMGDRATTFFQRNFELVTVALSVLLIACAFFLRKRKQT